MATKGKRALAGALALALACAPALAGCSQQQQEGEQQAAQEALPLTLSVAGAGYDKATSTPAIAHIVAEDGSVDLYHAFDLNEASAVEVMPGALEVTVISPVNADGSAYRVGPSVEGSTVGADVGADGSQAGGGVSAAGLDWIGYTMLDRKMREERSHRRKEFSWQTRSTPGTSARNSSAR